MPIYEYRCRECGEHFERRQTLSDEPLKTCEKCGGELEKQWSLSGFQFKGAGWYVTDYAKSTGKDKKETSDKGQKESGGQSTDTSPAASNTKSETTPASKNDSGSKKE
jgi:putative FmdB family regulatory protein